MIVPEFDLNYSFENGLDEWYASGVDLSDPPVTWTVTRSAEEASVGSHSVALMLDNANAGAKIWIERGFETQPERAYDIEISFDFGTSDAGGVTPWRIIAGAHSAPPTGAADLIIQDATSQVAGGGPGVDFGPKRYVVRATADEDGQLFVTIGVWGTSDALRTYFVDNVRLLFTRVSAGG